MRTLAKVGLVELDADEAAPREAAMSDEDARRIIAEAAGRKGDDGSDATLSEAPARAAPPPVQLPAATDIEEGQSFDTLYQLAQIKPSPFSAEKLLRLLEGLKVMDPASRTTAVKAMDSADDTWTIEDPIIDAQRKVGVLEAGKRRMTDLVNEADAAATTELAAQEEYSEKATAQIRQQIAELEELLHRELEKVANERASVHAKLKATKEAAARERQRLDAEIERLGEITKLFSATTSEPKPGSL